MDPLSGLALTGTILGIVDVIARSINGLTSLQSRYKRVDLKIQLLVGQLTTLKAALKQVDDLVTTSQAAFGENTQLVTDLKTSIGCCEAIILVLDDRICQCQRNEGNGLSPVAKAQLLWDEKDISDFQNVLNNQLNALNLLLTAMHWYVTKTPEHQKGVPLLTFGSQVGL